MVNVDVLKGKIIASGYTMTEFRQKLGMTEATWRRRIEKKVFGSDDIEKMVELLEIKSTKEMAQIFFANIVTH